MNYPGDSLNSDQIRVIELLPGQWDEEIHCDLYKVSLSSNPHYEALSYVWGSKGAQRKIRLNGQIHSVTFNLYCALRRFRRKESPTILWVDALCINQTDIGERTHQVRMMGQIYKMCAIVIVYLGEGSSNSKSIPDFQGDAVEYFGDDRDLGHIRPFMKGYYTSMQPSGYNIAFDPRPAFALIRMLSMNEHIHKLPLFEASEQTSFSSDRVSQLSEALRCMMNNPWTPWWSRIWVVQEVVMPREVKIVYGNVSAPWTILADAARFYAVHTRSCCSKVAAIMSQDCLKVLLDFSQRISAIEIFRKAYNAENSNEEEAAQELESLNTEIGSDEIEERSLLSLLQQFRDRQATDPRDKIYALLSLVKHRPGQQILSPDYSLSEIEVFRGATLKCISDTGSLSVLNSTFIRKLRQDLPTWMPDWGAPGEYTRGGRTEALALYNSYIRFSNRLSKLIRLAGRYVGAVTNVGDIMWSGNALTAKATLLQWIETINGPSETKRITWRELCNIFCADVLYLSPNFQGRTRVLRTKFVDRTTFLAWTFTSNRSPGPLDGLWYAQGKSTNWVSRETDWQESLEKGILEVEDISDGLGFFGRVFSAKGQGKIIELIFRQMGYQLQEDFKYDPITKGRIGDIMRYLEEEEKKYMAKDIGHKPFSRLEDRIVDGLGLKYKEIEHEAGIVDHSIMTATLGRRLIITDNQYIGLGPAESKVGDHLFLLDGARTPFVLRRSIPFDERYKMVGDCYVQGLMDADTLEENLDRDGVRDWNPIVLE
ncbi:heterokaryon incompatibility protein-domain-containing protein [Clohesyomyces aquaticus]|uniref:Heterokaryon incompatibility protein-domain-containing protein n=1 Tax=Clohesyomyces aquaticus TaxID=1231657 RepID=A0A1Y1ZW87_9PLEO|nr:heterokaryon incompatibility protein-domain-containing protein [Clohesyomyces aquaticus]